MLLLLCFAFLAGIVTVLSPCILPILPAILSASTAGGKRRPLGIIIGLICSFSFFTLSLTAIVSATGLSAGHLRGVAIFLIFFFGLVMLFPRLSNWFAKTTAVFASAGQKIQPRGSESGFWGGVIFGVALGLLWTPCAGPILGAITTLVATHAVSASAVLLTLAYSIGAGIPLFLITYGSSKIVNSSRFLSKHTEKIRCFFGGVMVLLAVALTFHWEMVVEQKLLRFLPQSLVENNPRLDEELSKVRGKLPMQGKAPEFAGITQWINSPPLTMEKLRGKVVLIDFWTYSCINCLRTLPYLKAWDTAYRDKGLVIVGVHTPEFEFEKDPANVEKAVKDLGIFYPVALDNNYETWSAYHNQYWPAHYLIDQEGNIRMVHFGEGAYSETENGIRALLGLAPLTMKEFEKEARPLTPETYLGSARGGSYISEISLRPGEAAQYSFTPPLGNNQVGLKGLWRVESEYIEAEGDACYLDLNFLAKQVYLVLAGSSSEPLQVFLDGKLVKKINLDGDRKYDIASTSYGRHQLSIRVPRGIRAYAFTFGDE